MADVSQHASDITWRSRGPSKRVLLIAGSLIVLLAVVTAVIIARNQPATGDAGQLVETPRSLPDDVAAPTLVDATSAWRLDDLSIEPSTDQMAGGVAVADIDGDGQDEIVIANGDVVVLSYRDGGLSGGAPLAISEAIGAAAADVDGDGFDDVLVATADDVDVVVWGGPWVSNGERPEMTELPAQGQSSGLMAAELSNDGLVDIVRLGRGMGDPVPDLLWVATGPRSFRSTELPIPDRFTLAGEIVDADRDGLLDIWLTRDVGWARGGDTVLSRQGDADGPWVDVAAEIGVALQVDGMGITVADLNGDATLDAYVSDLGDNEQLLGSASGFSPAIDTGAAHIRPVGAPSTVVSSTWGTGALDINLDGVLDLALASGGFPIGDVRNKIDDTTVVVAEPPAVLLGIGDGEFVDVWPTLGIDLDVIARGMTVVDVDLDGDHDLIIVDRLGAVYGLRNDTPTASVTIRAAADCGVTTGHVVTVTTDQGVLQRVLSPHGYASSHGQRLIVGNPSQGDVRVAYEGPRDQVASTTPQETAISPGRNELLIPCTN